MAKLFKRGRVWYAWVRRRGGGVKKVSTLCTSKPAAERAVAEIELENVDPRYAAAKKVSTRDVLADYFLSRGRLGRSAGTLHHVKTKGGHLARLLPALAADVTHPKLLRYIDARLAEGTRRTTIKKELRVMKAALRLARRNGKWHGDPDAVIPELEDDYVPRTRWLTPWELIALVAQLDRSRAAHVTFIVATSARWGESLRFVSGRDIRRDASGVYARLRGTKTKASDREVPIVGAARSMLAWAINDRSGFSSWGNVRRDLAAACVRAGIEPVTPNDLRRTFAKWLRNAGAAPSSIGAAMGHVDSRMVERVYGRIAPEALGLVLEQQTRGLLMGGESPNMAPLGANRETALVDESPEKQTDSGCAGTESNRRHGDFQADAPVASFDAVKACESASAEPQGAGWWATNGRLLRGALAALHGDVGGRVLARPA
jgi:integrase